MLDQIPEWEATEQRNKKCYRIFNYKGKDLGGNTLIKGWYSKSEIKGAVEKISRNFPNEEIYITKIVGVMKSRVKWDYYWGKNKF